MKNDCYLQNMENKTILGLRTCNHDMTAYGGFIWPTLGTVQCNDWNPKPVCGGGLHFLPWGEGNGTLLSLRDDAKWLVVKVDVDSMVSIDSEKAKSQSCEVVFCGDRHGATQYIANNGGHNYAITGITLSGGNRSSLNGGYMSTLTGGDESTLIAGDRSTLTAEDRSTLIAGVNSTLTAGHASTLYGGHNSTLTAGERSTLTCGGNSTLNGGDNCCLTGEYHSTLTAGDCSTLTCGGFGTLTAGDFSTLTAGDFSTLTAGDGSILTAGDQSVLSINYYNNKRAYKLTGYIGFSGFSGFSGQYLLPNVSYTNQDGKFVVSSWN